MLLLHIKLATSCQKDVASLELSEPRKMGWSTREGWLEDIYQNMSSFSFPASSLPPTQLSVLRGYDCEHLKLELPVICSAGFTADATYFFFFSWYSGDASWNKNRSTSHACKWIIKLLREGSAVVWNRFWRKKKENHPTKICLQKKLMNCN